jgi:ribosomal protein S18 acetylase RimI-like enzyme
MLRATGITSFMLGVDADNLGARRVYESLGFEVAAERRLAYLAATGR